MPTVRLADRTVLHLSGADTRPFLQGLLTNDLDNLTPETPLYAGLLSPQGKALFDMILFDGGDQSVLIDVAATRAAALAKRLTLYRLRKAVTIAASDLAVHAAWGDGGGGVPDPRLAALGGRWVGPADTDPGDAAYAAHRLSLGVPDSADIGDDELLWLETDADLLNGVSFTKGCYVGQENTARMHHRDKVRRRLLPVRFAGDVVAGDVVAGGDPVLRDAQGRAAGSLRSLHGGIGIAHLRVEAAGTPLMLGGATAEVMRPGWLAGVLPAMAA